MTLSLALIAKDEEAYIGHCLASVRGLVDEMVVVDTGSTDATVDIATQAGAKVFHFPWVDDFAAARNESLRHCTGDWVLILDADEAVDGLDFQRIREACNSGASEAWHLTLRNYHTSGGYYIRDLMAQPNRSSYQEGRQYPFYVDTVGLRLCRRAPDLAYTGRIHELLDPWFQARSLPIGNLTDAVIHHFGKMAADREQTKTTLYLDLAKQDLASDPANTQFHYNVVMQGLQAQDWPTVLASATAYLRLRKAAPSVIRFGAGLALGKLGRHREALAHFETLLRMEPNHVLALTHRGIALAATGAPRDAERSFRKAIQANPRFPMPYVSLADLLHAQGRMEEAKALIRSGVEHCPSHPLILQARLLLDLRLNDMEQAMADARDALDRLPSEGEGLWHRLAALGAHRAGRLPEALAILDRGAALFPANAALLGMREALAAEQHPQP